MLSMDGAAMSEFVLFAFGCFTSIIFVAAVGVLLYDA
jgi:hypothetical protein